MHTHTIVWSCTHQTTHTTASRFRKMIWRHAPCPRCRDLGVTGPMERVGQNWNPTPAEVAAHAQAIKRDNVARLQAGNEESAWRRRALSGRV